MPLQDRECYTCLKTENAGLAGQMLDLQAKDTDDISYLDKLKCIFPEVLCESTTMQICPTCLGKLKLSYDFLQLILQTQNILRIKIEKFACKEEEADINRAADCGYNGFGDVDDDDESSSDCFLSDLKNSNKKPTKCVRCKKKFDTAEDLQEHTSSCKRLISEKDAESIKECTNCGAGFKSARSLNSHNSKCKVKKDLNESEQQETYGCTDCKGRFGSLNEFRTHGCGLTESAEVKSDPGVKKSKKRGRPSDSNLKMECPFCELTFDKQWILRKHVSRTHTQEKKYVCTYCNRGFKQSYHLREHITSHTGERNYSCDVCGKAFQRISSQKRHMRSHEAKPGQKTKRTPFLCTICGKSFPFSNGVQRHMRTHFGIKTHECNVCHRKFMQSTHLHVHMRTHTGEKPYICDSCGDAFALNASLQKHKLIHRAQASPPKENPSENGVTLQK